MLAFVLSACNGGGEHAASSGGANGSSAQVAPKPVGTAPAQEKAAPWRTVQTLDYDWAGDGVAYQFTLSIPDPWYDAGDFTRLQIARRGKVVYELVDPSGLERYQDEIGEEMKRSAKGNLLPSPYLLLLPGAGKTDKPVLFAFGWPYASSPGSLRVITLAQDGTPRESLYLETFWLAAYTDLNHDSHLELVGKKCFSQQFGPDLLTYDPYSVFRFGDGHGAPLAMDLALSEDYNRKHSYGWAGPDCREDVAVVRHPPGRDKPVILPVKEAEALFSKK